MILPLYAAYERLLEARHRRGTIELELPERKIMFDETGSPSASRRASGQASNMLIEEFMIAANVAAASELAEALAALPLPRPRQAGPGSKLEALAQFLEHLGVPWSRTAKQPGDFTRLLQALAEHDMREMVVELRAAQPGAGGLQPEEHRPFRPQPEALRAFHLADPPLQRPRRASRADPRIWAWARTGWRPDVGEAELASLGDHLSRTERKAMEAERRAFERLVAQFLADRVGAVFPARVTTAVYFGLFVTLDEIGADGLVPVSTLGDDAFMLDERHQALVGQRTGESFALGDRVKVELVEADPVQGTLLFRLDSHEPGKGAELARAAWKKGGPRKGGGARFRRPAKAPPRRRR